jgi:hypothetical protein
MTRVAMPDQLLTMRLLTPSIASPSSGHDACIFRGLISPNGGYASIA